MLFRSREPGAGSRFPVRRGAFGVAAETGAVEVPDRVEHSVVGYRRVRHSDLVAVVMELVHHYRPQVAVRAAVATGLGRDGQPLIITAGMPFGKVGSTNMVRVVWIGSETKAT